MQTGNKTKNNRKHLNSIKHCRLQHWNAIRKNHNDLHAIKINDEIHIAPFDVFKVKS